jgi:L-alanine-DL-glutamate epimerase-like enolase superfamily enzyme
MAYLRRNVFVMIITHTEIFKLTIPMEPFVIATETCYYTQNVFIRLHTDVGLVGMGECSAFPLLVGETQNTCFEVAQDFARLLKGKDPLDIPGRMKDLNTYIAFNTTVKSAFDIAFHDLKAKAAGVPLYKILGGKIKTIQTDLTIGIDTPEKMEETAREFIRNGVRIIKVKLGKNGEEDIDRVRRIRHAVGPEIGLRLDANQGWDFDTAVHALNAMAPYDIQFCEQPIHHDYDHLLPDLHRRSPIKIMADESVFNHQDAERLILAGGIDYINIKLAKSAGILGAIAIADTAAKHGIPCMLGGMVESRLALTAKVHLAMSHDNIIFYDLDTCLLGQLEDPVTGGAVYRNYFLELPEGPGLDADIQASFLEKCEKITI